MSVLVYGSMGNIADVVARSLRDKGIEVYAIGFPQNTFKDEPGYTRGLLKAIDAYKPTIIMPVGDTLAAARLKEELPEGIILPVDLPEKIELLSSKVRSSALAASLGIPQPKLFENAESACGNEIIFKRDKSFGGSGVYRPKTKEALVNLMNHEPGGRFLIEEYIEGDDYSVDALRWDGYWRAACYKSLSNRGQGPSTLRQSAQVPALETYARNILDSIDYHGVCGIDFRIDAGGNAYFLECNPRFTGGMEHQIASGFDIPYCLYTLLSEKYGTCFFEREHTDVTLQ